MGEVDPTDLEEQERLLEEEEAQKALAQEQEKEDITWLMSSKQGRRIVWRTLERSGVFRLSFNADSAAMTSFNEGRKNEGLRLFTQINAYCYNHYAAMVRENTDERSSEQRSQ